MKQTIQQYEVFTLKEMKEVALSILEYLKKNKETHSILLLSGDLGAGKTTFVQYIASHLGVEDVVTSPTFVLMNEYETNDEYYTNLVHIDLYRIEDQKELEVLQVKQIIEKESTLSCIEWPEQVPGFFSNTIQMFHVEISLEGDKRTLVFSKYLNEE